ncbi:MAG: hypothetical protein IPK13_11865 [Deltaproteobacteria bacterium]|nr:hypothetical protein [Deltaproteobacteria bacterium]
MLLASFSVSGGAAYAEPTGVSNQPKKKVVVEGWGNIVEANVADARSKAIHDAQKKAIEISAGVHVRSMMTDDSFSVLRGNNEQFAQAIQQKIEITSDGFVSDYSVLKEWVEGNTYKVELEVEVNDVALMRELAFLARRLSGARFPKIMFLLQEEYTDQAGQTGVVFEPTFQAHLEDAFLARGFDLVAQDQIKKLRAEEAEVFDDIITDENKAAKYAMGYGAEYVITGTARVRHTSFDDLGQKEHHGHAELYIRAVDASTAGVIASNKVAGSSPPNCFSEPDLRVRSVTHVGKNLIDSLIRRIVESWDKELANGVRYSVKLYGAKSFKKEGTRFITMIQGVPGVKQVKKLSFGGQRLELEVFFGASSDVSVLEREILRVSEQEHLFKAMDVTYSRGRELNFKL